MVAPRRRGSVQLEGRLSPRHARQGIALQDFVSAELLYRRLTDVSVRQPFVRRQPLFLVPTRPPRNDTDDPRRPRGRAGCLLSCCRWQNCPALATGCRNDVHSPHETARAQRGFTIEPCADGVSQPRLGRNMRSGAQQMAVCSSRMLRGAWLALAEPACVRTVWWFRTPALTAAMCAPFCQLEYAGTRNSPEPPFRLTTLRQICNVLSKGSLMLNLLPKHFINSVLNSQFTTYYQRSIKYKRGKSEG